MIWEVVVLTVEGLGEAKVFFRTVGVRRDCMGSFWEVVMKYILDFDRFPSEPVDLQCGGIFLLGLSTSR